MARVVLVADDSPTIQKKAVAILKGEGFEVETVSNGVAAIKRLLVLHPVVVLADVSMPGRDGYEVCEFVKKSAELSQVPVLLVASDMEPYDEARGQEVRADGIIKKPFEPRDLLDTVVKFAEQFEASMAAPAEPPPPPPEPVREPTQEIPPPMDSVEEAPTMVALAPPDFAATGGVALAEPAYEEPPGYPAEPAAEQASPFPPPPLMEEPPAYSAEPALGQPLDYYPEPTAEPAPAFTPPEAVEPAPAFSPEFAAEEAPAIVPDSNIELTPDYSTAPVGEESPVSAPDPSFEHMAAYTPAPIAEAEPAPVYSSELPSAEMAAPAAEPQPEAPAIQEAPPEPVVVDSVAAPAPAAPVPSPVRRTTFMEEVGPPDASASAAAPLPYYLGGLEAATPEPVFIEEQGELSAASSDESAEMKTMVFRAPLDIAEPVWKDETVPAPEPEAIEPPAVEPQMEVEAPAVSTQIPVEPQNPIEPQAVSPAAPSAEAAASFDSLFLEPVEATQEQLAPESVEAVHEEAVYSAPVEEPPAVEAGTPEPPMETAFTEPAPAEAPPEASASEPAFAVSPLDEGFAEPLAQEPVAEASYLEAAPAETVPEAAAAEPSAEAAGAPLAYDWPTLYTIVHKVVVRMAPPPLPIEVIEELARQIATEIATETSPDAPQPQV